MTHTKQPKLHFNMGWGEGGMEGLNKEQVIDHFKSTNTGPFYLSSNRFCDPEVLLLKYFYTLG